VSLDPRLRRVFSGVANDPASFIALGSVFMAAAKGGKEGALAYLAATVVIVGLKARGCWTGRERGRPFGALAAVNFITSGSIAIRAFETPSDPDFMPKILMAAAYGFWGIRSTL